MHLSNDKVIWQMGIGELPEYAAEQQRQFDSITTSDERKKRGHFGTPPLIAEFMAGLFSNRFDGTMRILDPGAGVGTLSAAVCQRALAKKTPIKLFFELWENDPKLLPFLEKTMENCKKKLRDAGHCIDYVIRNEDFILANTQQSLFNSGPEPSFHLAILNPPYFKLRKDSPQAHAMAHVVHGQPNIYALFMAVAADLLLSKGEMVAITPRSYFNGTYFKRFRKWFFDKMIVRQIHLFDSRTEAFKDDSVLQENVILHAESYGNPKNVVLTLSIGRDLAKVERSSTSYDKVMDNRNGDHIVRITTNDFEHEIVAALDSLANRFRNYGFEVSTGPVVTFRSTEFLRDKKSEDTAPLLWMHNVRPFVTQFPEQNRKPMHIEVSSASKKLLVPAKTYVLLKRFTSKEEKRRLVAGILTPADSYSRWVGLENHLNYVYRKEADLDENEAYGLAAFFNSALVDRYFRAISGNTQVNANEIRGMPVPTEQILRQIGQEIKAMTTINQKVTEQVVCQALCLPRSLMNQLIKVAQ